MVSILEYLKKNGYSPAEDTTMQKIIEWADWYEGDVKDFHHYDIYNGISVVEKTRNTLGMAKTVSEDWANLLLNEKVKITTGNDFDKVLDAVFEYNNFRVKGTQLIELAFALGTAAFVEYKDASGEVVIDFIRAGMIYPLSWDNGYINECAFGSAREREGKKQYYIQIHKMGVNQKYVIENHIVDADTGDDLALDEGMIESVETGSVEPLFQIVSPNIVNNIDLDSPLGISTYGNAIPQLKGCDIVYDSYVNEFDLGKKRIMVPVSLAKIEMSKDGTGSRPVFDSRDTVFYALPEGKDSSNKIETFDPKIRASEHDIGINKALDLLSFKCGMGTGRYKFENGAVKTATEVISDKSDLYQSLSKHKIVLGAALKAMVRAIGFLKGKEIKEITIDFDDSIIQDKDAERAQDRLDVAMGVMSHLEYRMKWYNEDEVTAESKLPVRAEVEM